MLTPRNRQERQKTVDNKQQSNHQKGGGVQRQTSDQKAYENNAILEGRIIKIRAARKKKNIRVTPMGGRGNEHDNIAIITELCNVWMDVQVEIFSEEQDLQDEIRDVFNCIDEDEKLGDLMFDEIDEGFLNYRLTSLDSEV